MTNDGPPIVFRQRHENVSYYRRKMIRRIDKVTNEYSFDNLLSTLKVILIVNIIYFTINNCVIECRYDLRLKVFVEKITSEQKVCLVLQCVAPKTSLDL